jgi:hypothetical protein
MKRPESPRRISEAESGSIVRTVAGVLRIAWCHESKHGGSRLPSVRLLDPDTLHAVTDPVAMVADLEIVEVLRDQTYYRTHPRAGGQEETDPLKRQEGSDGQFEKAARDPRR